MEERVVTIENAEKLEIAEIRRLLSAAEDGLSTAEAEHRLNRFGPNEIVERKTGALLKFLGYFWGPIPWMIEVAAGLSLVVRHWADMVIITVLLVFNAMIGFWEEHKAANAIDALKRQLALKARSLRDGAWKQIPARELVPGDVIRLRLGEIVPADVKLYEGDYLTVDQSVLTGESLPVDKKPGEVAFSGSVARQGEMTGLVVATGSHTFIGRTAALVQNAGAASHFQRAVLQIGDYLIYLSLGLVGVLVLAQIIRHAPLLELAQFALILTVASIPVAMPAVLSVTMAVGALALSRMKAIVTRLESIEEMAGIDVLCSDKTGTLTQNRLTMGHPVVFGARDEQELILTAALASRAEDQDAIDLAVIGGLQQPEALADYDHIRFIPFDPIRKRTEAAVKDSHGRMFHAAKGAPQVILQMCRPDDALGAKASQAIEDYAAKGYRTLGVARSAEGDNWTFMGIVPLYDPPREDSAETIAQAGAHGIQVKMVTGDNTAIAAEVAAQLGMGKMILAADELSRKGGKEGAQDPEILKRIEQADGFAQVFPEHKYQIVKTLQQGGHLVAMTGDGVNDAPALKQAEVGIAVSGATDAARSAAAVVLTAPGLAVIVKAVEEARRIFERMNSYAVYRITETIRIMVFMVLAMLVYNFYPITAIMVILLALLNDLPIMTIAYDNTWLDPKPARWQLHRVLRLASILGGVGIVETFLLMAFAKSWLGIGAAQMQSIIFLKLAVAGHLTLFVARSRRPFYAKPHPAPALWAAILCTQAVAVMIVGFGWFVTAIPWSFIAAIWAYCLAWMFIEDYIKLRVYHHMGMDTPRHQAFLRRAQQSMGPHGMHGLRHAHGWHSGQ